MKKRLLALLLALVMVVALLPTIALAADSGNTLQFSTDLRPEYSANQSQWGSYTLSIAVGTYTPAGGSAKELPAGTNIKYQWYWNTTGKIDPSVDTKMPGAVRTIVSTSQAGIKYYYAIATAEIDGVTYTGTTTLAKFIVRVPDITVTAAVNNQGLLAACKDGTPACGISVKVADLNMDGKHTYDEAMVALHKTWKSEADFAVSDAGLVTKLWGVETKNCLFYLNDKTFDTKVTETTLKKGDRLVASLIKDTTNFSDKYTTFDLAQKTIAEGVAFDLVLKDGDGNALPGVQVGLWEEGAFKALEGKTTDEEGKVSLSFETAGKYYVTASGSVQGSPIVAPGCAVTVKKVGELRFDGKFGTNPYTSFVGEAPSFRGWFNARYFEGERWISSMPITRKWYRIGANSAVPEEVPDLYAKLTEADIGTWQYYLYAECDAYGVKRTARSNFITLVVTEPKPIAGNTSHGYITEPVMRNLNTSVNPDFKLEAGKTDYAINSLDNNAGESFACQVPLGKQLWYGTRENGIRSSKSDSDQEIGVMRANPTSISLPRYNTTGTTNVISVLVGTKYDSNQNGTIDMGDEFDLENTDVYNFTVTEAPALSALSLKDAGGNAITLDTTISSISTASEVSGLVTTDTVKLTANFKTENGVKLYLGKNTEPYTARLQDVEVNLADYRDAKGVANIPLKLVYEGEGGQKLENTYTLHLTRSLAAENAPTITKQPITEASVAKDKKVALSIEAKAPKDGLTLSYQWLSTWSERHAARGEGTAIEGATSATYEAPAQAETGEQYFFCRVTATDASGAIATAYSDACLVTTELTYVNTPVITVQPGLTADKQGLGVYRTEYPAGTAFDEMWFAVRGKSENRPAEDGSHNYVYVTETGCAPYEVKFYYNTTPSVEGAKEIPGTIEGSIEGSDRYQGFLPEIGLPQGENYVFFTVTSTSEADPTKSASTVSNFVKLTYTEPDYGFEGDGSESNPYLLKSADDFVTIQKQTNEANITFANVYFKMANDITLPADWVSIGANGNKGSYFSGVLDGGGYQLNYADQSQPLFKYVSRGTIKNLKIYGKEIQGAGLIGSYWIDYHVGANISNVTLVSGTSTKDAGLMAGASSSMNPSYIKNCVAEEGVVIGYDKKASGIGTFSGGLVGTIENCRSAATVYGGGNIGGIVGSKANSMGMYWMKNCSFTGKIEATGNFVGGIAGGGYVSNSAPNATCARIENCYVNAEITGKSAVGGIFGGEGGVDQCWDNGIGYIRNNVFYGKLTVTKTVATEENIGGSKGGIIGYMRSLNRYNVIENNYFYDANGTTKAIGGVEHIDTSTHEFGMDKASNIFYYDTSRDSIADIKDWVDREDKDTPDWQYTSVPKTNHNRTDDPMGKDSEKLGKPCTVEEMKDGTVVALLNNSETSQKNWEQGETSPVISNKKTVTGLTISGDYKTEYYIGDELDLTGAIFTATWSDDSQTTVDLKDVTVTGFDSSARAVLKLTASYSGATCEFTVKVLKKGGEVIVPDDSITVYFTLLGDEKHGDPTSDSTHTLASNNLTPWLEKEAYKVDLNATVWDLMQEVAKKHGDVSFSNPGGNYVDSITYGDITLAEFDNGTKSGWMYTLNDKHPLLGVSQQFLDDGDSIVFHYTDDYTVEEGSEDFDDDHIAAGKVTDAINALPAAADLTLENKEAVAAARAAFDALTEAQQALVSKEAQDKLTACEARIAELEKPDVPTDLPFTDLTQDWYMDSIRYVYEHELMYGTTDTTFAPDDALTRGMFVTMLYRMEGKPEVTGNTSFTDVPANMYYAPAIAWASANGVVYGTSETAFSPEGKITREQMAAMMRRYASFKKLDTSAKADITTFVDASAVSAWASDDMKWAVASELLYGNNHNELQPTANATRAQAAAILQRFATKIVK